jgi:hypothetical protein
MRTPLQRLVDHLPDLLTTSLQGAVHLVNGPIDLATMPPRRRRRFDWLRFNLKHATDTARTRRPVNGFATPLTLIGEQQGRYVYQDDFWGLDRLRARVGNGDYVLEIVDVHCLDHLQHWLMGDRQGMRELYAGVDDFVAALHAKCRQKGLGFVLLSDHGMEPVERVVDLVSPLRALPVPPDEYDLFVENTKATFWFHSSAASATIAAHLEERDDGTLLDRAAMARYELAFPDNRYGDAFFYARPGATFFPNDFHQPLAALIMSATDRQQRQRFRTPWHQADHGYLSESDSEIGFMVLAEDGYAPASDAISLIDIAPTLLDLLGREPAATMRGRSAFRPDRSGSPASAAS